MRVGCVQRVSRMETCLTFCYGSCGKDPGVDSHQVPRLSDFLGGEKCHLKEEAM